MSVFYTRRSSIDVTIFMFGYVCVGERGLFLSLFCQFVRNRNKKTKDRF